MAAKEIDFWEEIDRTDSEVLSKKSRKKDKYALGKAIAKKIKEHQTTHKKRISVVEEILSIPLPGEQYRIVTQKTMNIFTIILFVLKHHKRIDSSIITTFNMNEITISSLLDLFDNGLITNLRIVVSESVRFRMPKRVEQLKEAFEKRKATGRFHIALTWNHTKITLMQCANDHYICEGSGNFSENAEIEQYIFENNKEVFDFHQDWILNHVFKKTKDLKRHEIWQ